MTRVSGEISSLALSPYNKPAASGMTCAGRLAGARKPALSTSAGPRPPDARTGRAPARRLSLLPVLALLLGALSPFASAPASADVPVGNIHHPAGIFLNLGDGGNYAQGFTTGSAAEAYVLTSIDAVFSNRVGGSISISQPELWSATSGGAPNVKTVDLRVPSSVPNNAPVSLSPQPTTLLTRTTKYFLLVRAISPQHRLDTASKHDEDSGSAAGWNIENACYIDSASSWTQP